MLNRCILKTPKYLNVFLMHLDLIIVYFIIFVVYFNVFQIYLQYVYGVFWCIYSLFKYIWLYLDVFIMYFNVFQMYLQYVYGVFWCIYSVFQYISMYPKVFECIGMYLHYSFMYSNVLILCLWWLQCTWNYLTIFECIYSIFDCIWMYFECIYSVFQCILVYFNVFESIWVSSNIFKCIYQHCNWNITITILLYYFCHAHPPIYLFFTIHNDSLPNKLYHYILFSHFHWSVPSLIQSMKILHTNSYFSHLYITPHFMFHI
jgi:hypothetical protein